MPADKAVQKDNGSKPISSDVAACIIAVLNESNVTIGAKHYKLMQKVDGKTESTYDHMFRPIKAKAKQISEVIKKGELGDISATPVKKASGDGNGNAAANGEKKKGGKRGKYFRSSALFVHVLMTLIARKAKSEGAEDGNGDEGAAIKRVKREATADSEIADANGEEKIFG